MIQAAISQDGSSVVLQLTASDKGLSLLLNTNTDLRKDKPKYSQIQMNEQACDACDMFATHSKQAIKLAQSIMGGDFNYDIPDAE